MSAISSIEWTDRTWNPVRGCSVVSPGCVNCYAMKTAHRFSGPGGPYEGLTKQTKAGPQWTGVVRTVERALLEPLSWRKPARVFVNSMSDLFHEDVPNEFIDRVFAVMALAHRHTFQILTKRGDRMQRYVESRGPQREKHSIGYWAHQMHPRRFAPTGEMAIEWPLPNVWFGVSCENQEQADARIQWLSQTPAAVRWVSAEPLLGAINFEPFIYGLDWVVVGGESGHGARPFNVEWARSIVQQCQAAAVPVFVKQLGADPFEPYSDGARFADLRLRNRKGGDITEWPAKLGNDILDSLGVLT